MASRQSLAESSVAAGDDVEPDDSEDDHGDTGEAGARRRLVEQDEPRRHAEFGD